MILYATRPRSTVRAATSRWPIRHRSQVGCGSTAGISLTELLVTIAVIGIFAGLVIAAITGITQAGQREVATYNLNKLNAAVTAYNNANAELVVSSTLGIGDETAVFALLQARNEANPVPGTPYLEAHIPFVGTSSNERHRAVWNGRYFQLLPIGIDGTGIDLEAIGK